MGENGLKARQKRRCPAHDRQPSRLSGRAQPPSSRGQALLGQDFTAERPNQKWGAGISYVWTREGWLYLAVVIDLFASSASSGANVYRERQALTQAVSGRLHKQLALRKRSAKPLPCGGRKPV
jgi:putative transposase